MHLPVTKIELSPDRWHFNIISPRSATITNPQGKRQVSYFGFVTQEKALAFKQWLEEKELCTTAIARRAERLTTEWECKVWGAKTELILKLAIHSLEEIDCNGS
ncbi:hypothetical protein [Chroococcidiopsis sp.]|uniref:hypothetical protein n=1 Tax=Chroococcidiopsis sp. TaxID=3088168 RepID=UPI003F40F237